MDFFRPDRAALELERLHSSRPFAERYHELLQLLRSPILDVNSARDAAQLAGMLDEPDSPERQPGSAAAQLMAREVDRLGVRLRPLGLAMLSALTASQAGGGGGSRRRRRFEEPVALLHQHQAALSLLTMSCSFMFEGTIPATASALHGVAAGYSAMLLALLPLLRAVRQHCQPSRDARLLGGCVMLHCDCLWRTVGCFQAACGGEQWPLFTAILPAQVALPWVRELLTWAEMCGPHFMDLAPTLAMLGRLLLAHQPLQASLEQDLPLQRQLLRPLLRVAVPPAGQPETITWDGDCEDASQVLCSPGLAPALREQSGSPQGLRTLQAALRLLQQPLPDASQQADAEQLEEAQHAVSKHTARLQLFATLVCAALQGSASQQRDATVACLWAEGQAAAVAAVRGWRALLDAPGLELQHLSDHLGAALGAVVRSAFAVDTSLFRGRRGLRAALSGTSASVCLVWQLLQLSLPAAAGGPRHADMLPSAEAVASALCAVTLGLGHAVEQCSKAVAAAADGSDLMEQLRLVWQEHAAACCLMRSMAGQPADDAAHMMMLLNACNLACQLLGAAVFLADACSNGAEADVQRQLECLVLAHLAAASSLQQLPGSIASKALQLMAMQPCLTGRPQLQAAFEAGGGLALYMQAIRSLCEETPTEGVTHTTQIVDMQLHSQHASQAVAAELVASGLQRALAAGGRAAQLDGPAAEELADALGGLARRAVMLLRQAGTEVAEAAAGPSVEQLLAALDAAVDSSIEDGDFSLTPAALDAAEPLARAVQQLWERKQTPERQAEKCVRMARAAALRPCSNLACPNLATGVPLKGKRCAGCRAVRYCSPTCQAESWHAQSAGHRSACKLLQAEVGSG